MEELKKEVRKHIGSLFQWWESAEVAEIEDAIVDEVCDDVIETSDYPNHNSSDIRIAIKRVIINKLRE